VQYTCIYKSNQLSNTVALDDVVNNTIQYTYKAIVVLLFSETWRLELGVKSKLGAKFSCFVIFFPLRFTCYKKVYMNNIYLLSTNAHIYIYYYLNVLVLPNG